jgi:hypothetical protein
MPFERSPLTMRTTRKTLTFKMPFSLEVLGRTLPAGSYEVITDEELIERLSFPVYRRIATNAGTGPACSISRNGDRRST